MDSESAAENSRRNKWFEEWREDQLQMDDSAKAFEEWYLSDEKIWKTHYRDSAIAAWRASGRWHRLGALRECLQAVDSIRSTGCFGAARKIEALIAAEERKEGHE